jgi:NTP pyrophosphatase (non-canonical NTP hydrolase)
VKDLIDRIYRNAVNKGFWEASDNIPEKVMLVVTELAEGVEAYRNDRLSGKDGFAEEMADAVIRIFDICGHLDIDIEDEIVSKVLYNEQRPYLHGKKF